ncbi:MAG: CDP-diacylglycerol--glycerol-3-phosphate 3-phosphatidyltransferase [Bacilli bacterium]|nr:CDP-diacylglycerol--glycerol-3-phosphate 3-phosphatidyltransferase [Bacilli bacterium]
MNLPNRLTLSRIALIGVMIIGILVLACIPNLHVEPIGNSSVNPVYLAIAVIFVIAALTDLLDGKIARKYNLVSDFGKFLDPIADKLLNDGAMIFLLVPQAYAWEQRRDPVMLTVLLFCVVLMIGRDLVVDGLRMIAVRKNIVIAANKYGKLKTVLQMVAIPMLLLNDWPFSYFDANWPQSLQISNIFFYLATIMSVISGVIYVVQNRKVFSK